jgi:hypothetical protein
MGMMQVKPMITLTSHKNSKMFFVTSMAWRSSLILTTKIFYFTKTLFARNNITIHLIFPLQSNFFPKFSPTIVQTCIAPKLLDRLKSEYEVKTTKEQGVGARSLARSTLGVERHARISGWD